MDDVEYRQARWKKSNCLLNGNPSIGKSMFLVYHLLKLLEEAHRNQQATDLSKRAKANGLKIFLCDGRYFYVYSRRTGWLRINGENFWVDMHTNEMCSQDAWLLVYGHDLGETACRRTVLVSSPNVHNYTKFKKNEPRVNVLPTWSWDEVEHMCDQLLDLAISKDSASGSKRVLAEGTLSVISRPQADEPCEEEKADDSSEVAEFFSAPAGTVFYLDKARIRRRFEIWGGVLSKLFSLEPLEGLRSLFRGEDAAKLWTRFTEGDFKLFEAATEENWEESSE